MLLLAAALRFHDITRLSLNNDEIAEIRWTSGSYAEMMEAVRGDAVHPPLDYLLQFAITHAHLTEWVHRVPAALFGVGTVAAVILLATLWFNAAAGVAAGFFLAIAPMHVRYSQEVRPYSLAIFLVCASIVALEWYARTRQRKWAVAWFILVFLGGASLYFAGMVAGATSLFRIFLARRYELAALWRRLPVIIAAWVLLYAPWLTVVFQLGRTTPPAKPDVLDSGWWGYRTHAFATGDVPWDPISLGSWAFWIIVAAGIVLAFRFRALETAVFWFVAGTALELTVLQIHPHFSTPRYLYPSWPGAVILAGATIGFLLQSVPGRAIAPFVLLLFAGHSALTLENYFRGDRSDWRAVARYVHDRVKPGETVILTNNWSERNFNFYWRRFGPMPHVNVIQFEPSPDAWAGPAWIVTGQCSPRRTLPRKDFMAWWVPTDEARVYYIRPGESLRMDEELCPE